jgi:hypothetical protein
VPAALKPLAQSPLQIETGVFPDSSGTKHTKRTLTNFCNERSNDLNLHTSSSAIPPFQPEKSLQKPSAALKSISDQR